MKIAIVSASLLLALTSGAALAQANMSCADYLKADAQMQGQMSQADKAAMGSDPAAAEMDRKVRSYCQKNPKVPVSEAMEKALN